MTSPFFLDGIFCAENTASLSAQKLNIENLILFDGVFKGDYSLALVNRFLARALIELGLNIDLYAAEENWESDHVLATMPDVRNKIISDFPMSGHYDIHLRNNWPPTANDMVGKFNAYVCFAWEEMEFPDRWVREFNNFLDVVLVTSNFVKDALLNSGITIPVYVVGNGCDHFLNKKTISKKFIPVKTKSKNFLHVSSCFPRKGVDVLIEAFSKTFHNDENVGLVIKTFVNPHNNIKNLIADSKDRYPNRGAINLIEDSLDDDKLKDLFLNSIALVAPSRGEGFGLPLAEAMLMNVPVITTGYSGQLDFCKSDTSWLVDFNLVKSKAHVAGPFSMWAEPNLDSLCQKMRAVLDEPDIAIAKSTRAKTLLLTHFSWSKVANRINKAIELEKLVPSKIKVADVTGLKIDVVSSWQQQCGIATYCESLMSTSSFVHRLDNVFARVYASDDLTGSAQLITPAMANINRVWGYDLERIKRLGDVIDKASNPIIWFQHHPGFFSLDDMKYLTYKLNKSKYRVKAITLHNVKEIVFSEISWLNSFDLVFLHTTSDAELLSSKGIRNLVVTPHGVPSCIKAEYLNKTNFTVGAFGFLYPHKNIPMLIQAIAIAREFSTRIKLQLLNCAKSDEISRWEQARVETMINALGAKDYVDVEFDFLNEQEIISKLSKCSLIAFPYGESNESATGAARIALAANSPLLISQSSVLNDLFNYAHRITTLTPQHLAESILTLASCPDLLHLYDLEKERFTDSYSYEAVARRYAANMQIAFERKK